MLTKSKLTIGLEEQRMNASETSLSTVIRERRSVRKYDPGFMISQEEILDILKEATLAPSSSNLQPWKFIVIQDEETKRELRSIANNQEQAETASAVIAVLATRKCIKMGKRFIAAPMKQATWTKQP
jgi:nitroreductase